MVLIPRHSWNTSELSKINEWSLVSTHRQLLTYRTHFHYTHAGKIRWCVGFQNDRHQASTCSAEFSSSKDLDYSGGCNFFLHNKLRPEISLQWGQCRIINNSGILIIIEKGHIGISYFIHCIEIARGFSLLMLPSLSTPPSRGWCMY